MTINVDSITLDSWEDGFPFWFHIKDENSEISFTQREVYAIRDALSNLIHNYETNLEKQKEKRKTA